MRICSIIVALLFLAELGTFVPMAGEYELTNGDVIRGEPVSFNDEGFIARLDIGRYSPRVNWARLTQGALKELAKRPEAKQYAEPFIEVPPEVKERERARRRQINLREVPRVEAASDTGLHALVATPAGIFILLVLFAGNLFAAYEVAIYRERPAALVCSVSALLPVIGPLLFLSMPPGEPEAAAAPAHEAEAPEAINPMAGTVPGGAAASGLGIQHQAKAAVASSGVLHFKRGDVTFNRRFFETKLSAWFRVVPGEAEKDLVLVVRTPKTEYVGKRISRISASELHIQNLRGGEVNISIGEIAEVLTRPKDAKG